MDAKNVLPALFVLHAQLDFTKAVILVHNAQVDALNALLLMLAQEKTLLLKLQIVCLTALLVLPTQQKDAQLQLQDISDSAMVLLFLFIP